MSKKRGKPPLKMVVGLGNPGPKYENTRHNLGFMTVDSLAEELGDDGFRKKFQALYLKTRYKNQRLLLVKPLTFMNLSGNSLRQVINFWGIAPTTEMLVVYDDISLPLGKLRIRKKGGAGGHNGVKSIIDQLGTSQFDRIRMGIGQVPGSVQVEHVLGKFHESELEVVKESIAETIEAIKVWTTQGIDTCMNQHN